MYEIINCHATYTKQGDAATQLDEQPIYGSSRLGVFRGSAATAGIVRGTRVYEASNHLGNVLLTFSDRKVAVGDGSYKADVTSASDYYAFGMTALGRSFTGQGYRFGFNGKEHDKEITNDDYDFGARIYDARIGKFLSIDPLYSKTPSQSLYLFGGDNPILYIDFNGHFKLAVEATNDDGNAIKVERYTQVLQKINAFITDKKNEDFLKEIAKESGLSVDKIKEYTEFGKGPTVVVRDGVYIGTGTSVPGAVTESDFSKGEISINGQDLNHFEEIAPSNKTELNVYELVWTVKTLHELIHYGDRETNDGKITGSAATVEGNSSHNLKVTWKDFGKQDQKLSAEERNNNKANSTSGDCRGARMEKKVLGNSIGISEHGTVIDKNAYKAITKRIEKTSNTGAK